MKIGSRIYHSIICLILLSSTHSSPAFAGTCGDFLARHIEKLPVVRWIIQVPQERWVISYLDPYYEGENFARSLYHSDLPPILRKLPIHYYSSQELLAARVIVRNGRFFRLNGTPLKGVYGMEYVLKPNGEILIMPHYSDPARGDYRLKHSSLANGDPVAASGLLSINEEGELIRIDRDSGHYKPGRIQLKQFLDHLKSLGVDLSLADVSWK